MSLLFYTSLVLLLSGVAITVSRSNHQHPGSQEATWTQREGSSSTSRRRSIVPDKTRTAESPDLEEIDGSRDPVNDRPPMLNTILFAKDFMLHWSKLISQMMEVLKRYEDRTKMLVFDAGSATVYRIHLGSDLSDYSMRTYNIPDLKDFVDVAWDYVDDRLYILCRDYETIKSVYVNGTDLRNVTVLKRDSYAIAIEPFEKKLFADMMQLSGEPHEVVSMDTDGTNMVLLRRGGREAPHMGIDYKNKFLYWTENGCSCLYRVSYAEQGAHFEKAYEHIYLQQNPNSVDFENEILYGEGWKGTFRVDLQTESEKMIYSSFSRGVNDTVYDPKTDRIFVYQYKLPHVRVLATNGTLLGNLQGLNLTENKRKDVRINPL